MTASKGSRFGSLGIGRAFTDLQIWARQLKERGVLLAVCSKNTESNAKEPFERHPEMVLRLADIAVFVANWENKVDNIRHIQGILNIGLESMVFVDDNAVERGMVKAAIPEICVPDLPADPADYVPFLAGLNLFETASFSDEDAVRTQQYRDKACARRSRRRSPSEDDYLASLDMTVRGERFHGVQYAARRPALAALKPVQPADRPLHRARDRGDSQDAALH